MHAMVYVQRSETELTSLAVIAIAPAHRVISPVQSRTLGFNEVTDKQFTYTFVHLKQRIKWIFTLTDNPSHCHSEFQMFQSPSCLHCQPNSLPCLSAVPKVLSIPTHEHEIHFYHVFEKIFQFSMYKPYTYFVNFILKYFYGIRTQPAPLVLLLDRHCQPREADLTFFLC